MSRIDITYATFAAMMGDAYAVEVDQQALVYPEVYDDQVLLSYSDDGYNVNQVIESSIDEIFIDDDTDLIHVRDSGIVTTIRILIPIPSATDLADMLK